MDPQLRLAIFLFFPLTASAQVAVPVLGGPRVTYTPGSGHTPAGSIAIKGQPSNGTSLFCTTDGTPASAAAVLYTAPIAISATTTINCDLERMGIAYQAVQDSSASWTCGTHLGGSSGGWNCPITGGIGTNQPVSWVISFPGSGAPNTYTQTCNNPSSECQTLLMNKRPGDNLATHVTQHRNFKAIGDHTKLANMELDVFTHISTEHKWVMCGFQCNEQMGGPDGGHWQVDANGGWQTTAITQACPISTTVPTDVVYSCSFSHTDTGCGGLGCVHFDYAIINGTYYDLSSMNPQPITNPGYTNPICGDQSQNDCTNTGLAGSNPFTCGRIEYINSYSCTRGPVAMGYGPFTIP